MIWLWCGMALLGSNFISNLICSLKMFISALLWGAAISALINAYGSSVSRLHCGIAVNSRISVPQSLQGKDLRLDTGVHHDSFMVQCICWGHGTKRHRTTDLYKCLSVLVGQYLFEFLINCPVDSRNKLGNTITCHCYLICLSSAAGSCTVSFRLKTLAAVSESTFCALWRITLTKLHYG